MRYAKAMVPAAFALAAGLKVAYDALNDEQITAQEWVGLAGAALAALLVYVVPNTTTSPAVAARESVVLRASTGGRAAPLSPGGPGARVQGQDGLSTVATAALVALAVVLLVLFVLPRL